MTAEVRRASVTDAGTIADLRRAWVEEQAGGPVDDPQYDEAFSAWFAREHPQRVTWLALVDDEPVGMLNILVFARMPRPGRRQSKWAYLANFFVRAAHRRSGVGSRLLAACTEYADARDFARIVLSPSDRSVSLYLRHGFAPATSLLVRSGAEPGR
jgi:GNAT superfamily N-acetyltransferase